MFVKVFLVVVLVGPFKNALSDHPREYTSIQPYFEHSLYTKPFKDGKLEDLVIVVKYGNGYFPIIDEEEMNRYFEVTEGSFKEEFIVKSKDNVWWDKYEDAIFTLKIPDATPPVRTVVIVKRGTWDPPKLTHFEYSSYTSEFVDGILEGIKVRVLDGRGIMPFVLSDEVPDINYYFEVVTEDSLFGEDQFVVKSKRRWDRNEDAVFTLKIGDATLLSPAETVVIVKSQEIYPTRQPHFKRSLYLAQFVDGILESLEVRVIDGRGMRVVIKEDEDIWRYFEVVRQVENDDDVFIVRSRDGIKWDKIKDAVLTLLVDDASLYPPVETVVIIKSEEVSIGQPHFESSLYTAKLVDGILEYLKVRVIDGRGKPVLIKGDEDNYFEVIRLVENDDDEFIVRSRDGIKWDKIKDAVFTLLIDDASLYPPVETVVIIKSEEVSIGQPHFEHSSYRNYFENGIMPGLVVKVTNGIRVVPYILEYELRDYFQVVLDVANEDETYIVRSATVWDQKRDAVFTLRYDDDTLDFPVETVVVVYRENVPYFEHPLYTTRIVDGFLEELIIRVIDGRHVSIALIGDEDVLDHFEVLRYEVSNDNDFIVKSKSGRPWNKKNDALFTLMVDDRTLYPPVETVVIAKNEEVYPRKQPHFEHSFYRNQLECGVLEELTVKVIDGNGRVPYILEDELARYFKVDMTDDEDIFIVKSIAYEFVWFPKRDAVFTLRIDDEALDPPVETIVDVYKENIPYFEHSSYLAQFVDGFLKELEIKVIDGRDVSIAIIGDEDVLDYFEVLRKEPGDDVFIVKSINGKKWNKNTYAIFTLQIYDRPHLVETVVIVKSVGIGQQEPPRFEKSHYRGIYENEQLSISDEIRLKGNGKGDVRLEDAEMEKLFIVENTNGLVTIQNTYPLEVDVEEILLTLIVEYDGMEGSTVVLIKIVKVEPSCEGGNKYTFFLGDNHGVIVGL